MAWSERAMKIPLYWGRRAAAFAIDLVIAQFLAQALLNSVGGSMPTWVCAVATPILFVAYTMATASRGPEARTLGKRVTRLVIRSTDGSRPSPAALLLRTGVLAFIVIVDWSDVIMLTAAHPAALGWALVASISICVVLLSYGVLRQVQNHGATPHDAIAMTQVVELRAPAPSSPTQMAPGAVPLVVSVLIVSWIFFVGLAESISKRSCAPCREAEDRVAERFGALVRVTNETSRARARGGDPITELETRVWMPLAVAVRRERGSILSFVGDLVDRGVRAQGVPFDRHLLTQELVQIPLKISATHDMAEPTEATMRFEIGVAGAVNALHLEFGFGLDFSAHPYEGPEG